MNRTEVTNICRLVKALCPSQVFDQYTPDAWAIVLETHDYTDAQQAIRDIASAPLDPGKSRYIEPGHIIAGIRRIRSKRLEATPLPAPPDGLDSAAYLAWARQTRDAIANGRYTPGDTRPTIPAPNGLAAITHNAAPKPLPTTAAPDLSRMTDEEVEREKRRQLGALEALINTKDQP